MADRLNAFDIASTMLSSVLWMQRLNLGSVKLVAQGLWVVSGELEFPLVWCERLCSWWPHPAAKLDGTTQMSRRGWARGQWYKGQMCSFFFRIMPSCPGSPINMTFAKTLLMTLFEFTMSPGRQRNSLPFASSQMYEPFTGGEAREPHCWPARVWLLSLKN